jgi:hypothetical protein
MFQNLSIPATLFKTQSTASLAIVEHRPYITGVSRRESAVLTEGGSLPAGIRSYH